MVNASLAAQESARALAMKRRACDALARATRVAENSSWLAATRRTWLKPSDQNTRADEENRKFEGREAC